MRTVIIVFALISLQLSAVLAQRGRVSGRVVRGGSSTPTETTVSPASSSQDDIARRLLLPDYARDLRERALAEALTLDPQTVTPELRQALIATLDRENAREQTHYEAHKRGESLPDDYDYHHGEFYMEFRGQAARAVAALRDPEAISALARTLGTGNLVINALVEFGDLAAPAVLAVVKSNQSRTPQVDDGLRTLTRMVQKGGPQANTLAEIRRVANERLTGRQDFTVLRNAIALAAAVGTPELLARVRELASDPVAVAKLGNFDPDDQEALRRAASEALQKAR